MNIKISNVIEITENEIVLFVKELNHPLPNDLKKFFFEFNGCKPETNIFAIGDKNESGINEFIPISNILQERKNLDHIGEKIIPIAFAEGGNYVVIDLDKDSSVFFWDHEAPESMIQLAPNIFEFIESLIPFDPNSIELEDGQVESAWIDPDFLKSIE